MPTAVRNDGKPLVEPLEMIVERFTYGKRIMEGDIFNRYHFEIDELITEYDCKRYRLHILNQDYYFMSIDDSYWWAMYLCINRD